jgi:hypothetical protein
MRALRRILKVVWHGLAVLAVPLGLAVGLVTPASASTSAWTQYVYHANGNSLQGVPATASGTTASFDFTPGVFTALLTTSDKSLTGDLSNETLSDTVSVTNMDPTASFVDQNNGGCTPDNQTVRFYFTSPSASDHGFFTKFWWSNPVDVQLLNDGSGGVAPMTIAVSMSDPTKWSDWDGHEATSSPDVTAAFDSAISRVATVGLSFGGGCFFENGVSINSGTATFTSAFSESPTS